MNLKTRIATLATKAKANRTSASIGGNFDHWIGIQHEIGSELKAIDRDAGKGLVVGRRLSFSVADGSAQYLITKIRKNDVLVEWIPMFDGYFSDAVGLTQDRLHYVVNRWTVERQIELTDALNMNE